MYWLPNHCSIQGLQTRDILCDELLFGENGIAVKAYPQVRKDLFLLLDDGWDVGSSRGGTLPESVWFRPYIGSCQLSEEKFPGYGDTPPERLKTLVDKVKSLGWKGLGVWISPSISYGNDVIGRNKSFWEFWRIRMEWSKYAGIAYWKVDWGEYDMSDRHRKILSKLKDKIYPELIMEHALMRFPYNSRNGEESRKALAAQRYRLSYSDVLRTYDVTFALSIPTTLSRVAALLSHPVKIKPGCMGLINAEDELYLSAALGLTFGVMRHGIGDNATNSGPNWAFGGEGRFPETRPARRQLDEVLRAVRWQTGFAPAFQAEIGDTYISPERGEDSWNFTPDETWQKNLCRGKETTQRAPLVISRNDPPPEVTPCDETPPYIVTSRNPSGALSIATLGRVTPERGYYSPKADVRWKLGGNSGVIGIFGHYKSLALVFDQALEGKRVYAKDLIEDNFTDITDEIQISGNTLILDGAWIEQTGMRRNHPGDFSEPGLALRIGEPADFMPTPVNAAKIKRPGFNWLYIALVNIAAAGKTFGQRRVANIRRLMLKNKT